MGALFIGLAHSVVFGYGAVYATSKGLSVFEVSIFMVIITSFGALSQWPIGYLSDKMDRRIILIGVTLAASGLCLLIVVSSYISLILFFILTAIYSCMSLPMYSLAIAHTNDFLEQNEIVAASSAFAKLLGIGSIIGPLLVSSMMSVVGPNGFHIYLLLIHGLLGLFGLYRMTKRAIPIDSESQYVPLPRNITPAGMELNPITEVIEEK